MKKVISCLLLLSMLTMTGCTGDEASVSQNSQGNKSATESLSFEIPDIVDPYYNPYNERAATDGEYLYYCTLDAIYKMPLQGGETDTLYELSDKGPYLWSIALHGPYLYFIEGKQLYRVQKDGQNFTAVETGLSNQNISSIKCLNDTLYLSCVNSEDNSINKYSYMADIPADPDRLNLRPIKSGGNAPSSRGLYYSVTEKTSNAYEKYQYYQVIQDDLETNQKKVIIDDSQTPQYLVTDQYIFYLSENSIFRINLDGQGKRKLLPLNIEQTAFLDDIRLCNYDGTSIYCFTREEDGDKFYQINQETGEKEKNIAYNNILDIVNGYLYGMDKDLFIRMKASGGEWEYAPF